MPGHRSVHSAPERFVKFGIFVVIGIPSAVCAVIILYYFVKIRALRQKFQNQILFLLVFLTLLILITEVPMTLSYFVRGYGWFLNDGFCNCWAFLDYTLTGYVNWASAIFTVERYILVFHPLLLRTQRQRFFIHYLSLILSSLYLTVFYIYTLLIFKCEKKTMLDPNERFCGELCLEGDNILASINWLFNVLFPVFVIIIGSIVLLVRVLWKRRDMQRNLKNWSKNWKMLVQLLGVATVVTIVWLPIAILSLIQTYGDKQFTKDFLEHQLYYANYLSEMSIPFVVLFFLPEVTQRQQRRQIQPSVIDLASMTIARKSTSHLP